MVTLPCRNLTTDTGLSTVIASEFRVASGFSLWLANRVIVCWKDDSDISSSWIVGLLREKMRRLWTYQFLFLLHLSWTEPHWWELFSLPTPVALRTWASSRCPVPCIYNTLCITAPPNDQTYITGWNWYNQHEFSYMSAWCIGLSLLEFQNVLMKYKE